MASYKYNVVVDVSIATNKLNQGAQSQKQQLRSMEQEVMDSQRRMDKELSNSVAQRQTREQQYSQWNSQEIGRRRQAAIDDYQSQIRASERATADKRKALEMQSADVQRINARQLADFQKFSSQMKALDPFQSLGSRNQSLSSAASSLRSNVPVSPFDQKFNQQIRQLDPFQSLGNRQISLSQTAKDLKKFDSQVVNSSKGLGMWGQAFKGAFIGAIAGRTFSTIIGGITGIIGAIKDLAVNSIKLSGDFEATTNALAVVTGSSKLAKDELKALGELALRTPGLTLDDAQVGATRLRSLGFEAEITRNLVEGLAKQKLISGTTDEGAVSRVIINLQQLRAGSPQVQRDIQQMILSLPSLSNEINKTFGSLEKFKTAIKTDSQGALDKFAKGLADAQGPAGGFNVEMENLIDTFTLMGREFGEPIIDPLTDSIKNLTEFLQVNKSSFADWGQYVGDVIGGITKMIADFNEEEERLRKAREEREGSKPNTPPFLQKMLGYSDEEYKNIFSLTSGLDVIQRRGENDRKLLEEKAKTFPLFDRSKLSKNNTVDLSNISRLLQTPEQKVAEKQAEKQAATRQRQQDNANRQEIASIQLLNDEANTLNKNRFEVEQAMRDANIRRTVEDEMKFIEESGAAKDAFLKSEIKRVAAFYDRQIAIQDLGDEEVAKLTVEKNKTLSDLQTELKINAIKSWDDMQKAIEKKNEEIRRDTIESKELEIREVQSLNDAQTANLERAIDRQIIDSQVGFEMLIETAKTGYEEISRLTAEKYDLQLQDKSLTDIQIINLTKERDLTLLDLAQQNSDRVIEIEQRAFDNRIEQLREFGQQFATIYGSISGVVGSIIESVSDVGTFRLTDKSPQDYIKSRFVSVFTNLNNQDNYVADVLKAVRTRRNKIAIDLDALRKKTKEIVTVVDAVTQPPTTSNALTSPPVVPVYGNITQNEPQNVPTPVNKDIAQQIENLKMTDTALAGFEKAFSKQVDGIAELRQVAIARGEDLVGLFDELEKSGFSGEAFENYRLGLFDFETKDTTGAIERAIKEEQSIIDLLIKEGARENAPELIDARRKMREQNAALDALLQERQTSREKLQSAQTSSIKKEIEAFKRGDAKTIGNATAEAENRFVTQIRDTYIEIENLKYRIANTPTIDNLVIEKALHEDILAIRNRETEAIISQNRSRLEIDQQLVYSKTQADAKLLEFFASQKGITDILSDAKINLVTSAFSGLDRVAQSLAKNFGFAKDMVAQLIGSLLKLVANQIFMKLFGLSPSGNGQSGGFGGGGFGTPNFNPNASGGSSGGGIGSIFQQFFGGGRNGGANIGGYGGAAQGGLPSVNLGDGIPAPQLGGNGRSGGTGGLSGLGLGINIAALGATLIGQRIGGVGGSALQYGGLGAQIGFLFGGPVGALVGAGIGAISGAIAGLFGRSSRRKKEEKLRTVAVNDANAALDKLITQVQNDQIDGNQALEQADGIRKSYLDTVGALTDKKTRNIALKDVSRLDAKIEQLKVAVAAQTARRQRLELYAPTFADGGSLSRFATENYRHNPLGYQKGGQKLGYFPVSKQHAIYNERGSEYIFDAETTRNVGVNRLDLIRQTKGQVLNSMLFRPNEIQKKAEGGTLFQMPQQVITSIPSAPTQVIINVDGSAMGQILAQALSIVVKENNGSPQQISALSAGIENQGQTKLVEQIVETVLQRLGK